MEGEKPAHGEDEKKTQGETRLQYKRQSCGGKSRESTQSSADKAAEQAEKMAAQISALSSGAEEGEEGEAGHEGHEQVPERCGSLGSISDGAEQTDGAENRRGETDKVVAAALYPDIDGVGGNAGEEDEHQADTVAGESEEIMDDNGSKQAIAQQVDDIGMKGEGGGEAIPFPAVEDGGSVAGAGTKPRRLGPPLAAETVDKCQATAEGHAHGAEDGWLNLTLSCSGGPVTVFFQVGGDLHGRSLPERGVDVYGHGAVGLKTDGMADVLSREDQRAVVQPITIDKREKECVARFLRGGDNIGHQSVGGWEGKMVLDFHPQEEETLPGDSDRGWR